MRVPGTGSSVRSTVQAVVAAALCVVMIEQPLLAAGIPHRGPTAKSTQIQGDARVWHAMNRLTFGPRPGDLAAVEKQGLDAWFEGQLNPGRIDDSALQAKLQMFPAMQLSQAELMQRFPSPGMIRQMIQRKAALPSDPTEHAIYADNIAFYEAQQAKQAAAKAAAPAMAGGDSMVASGAAPATPPSRKNAPAQPAMGGDMAMSGGDMAGNPPPKPQDDAGPGAPPPAEHVEALFRDLDAVKILNLPPDQRLQKILSMQPKDYISFRQSLSGGEMGQLADGMTVQQRETLGALQGGNRIVSTEELQSRLIRDIYSERQLEAVMTDFWLNHFNVYIRKNQNEPYLIPAYERDTIRPNALGKFEDLLVATAKSPAMLAYLDNAQSIGPDSKAATQGPRFAAYAKNPQVQAALKNRGLNENYGRELMELHTLGVGGGYTQADVTAVAKVFTGWTTGQPGRPGLGQQYGGDFMFDERRHEPGSKTVLGKTINEAGEKEGLEVLHMLATSPATAKFISTKLAIRFVSDAPPPALVDRMAQTFLSSNGDIKAVLHAMWDSPEFWAPTVVRAKVKTPEEFVISAVRASGASVNNAQGLVQALDRLGMPLYGMQTPNGYAWVSDGWVSTGALVNRMNFALAMSADRLQGIRTDWTKLLGPTAMAARPVTLQTAGVDSSSAVKEKRLEVLLLGQPVSDRTRATVLAQSNDSTVPIQAAKDFQGGGTAPTTPLPIGGEYDPAMPRGRKGGGGDGPQRAGVPDDRQAAIMAGLLLGSPEFQRR